MAAIPDAEPHAAARLAKTVETGPVEAVTPQRAI
jgi:hypothetical protein